MGGGSLVSFVTLAALCHLHVPIFLSTTLVTISPPSRFYRELYATRHYPEVLNCANPCHTGWLGARTSLATEGVHDNGFCHVELSGGNVDLSGGAPHDLETDYLGCLLESGYTEATFGTRLAVSAATVPIGLDQWQSLRVADTSVGFTSLSVAGLTSIALTFVLDDLDNAISHLATSTKQSVSAPILEDILGVEKLTSDTCDIPFKIETK